MYFKQFMVEGLGCYSYLIGCPGAQVACVVDPKRDVQDYIDTARKNNMKITHVFETHLHADHISGNMELKSRTGAKIHVMEGTPVTYDHVTVHPGDSFQFGNAGLHIIATPGHTPHAMSILVRDESRSSEPWLILTGDCLFVGDIGRPDLTGDERIDEQVQNLYNSLYHTLRSFPESLEVFPAHGEGSLCGKGMSSKSNSTIGFEMRNNPTLNLTEEEFREHMSGDFPERPKSFTHIISMNSSGASLLERCPITRDLSPQQVKEEIDRGAVILDTRDAAAFGGVHIPGSINIGFDKQTANWIGMVIDPGSELVLVVNDESAYHAMVTQLHRIGYDSIIGFLSGGISAWQEMGYPISHLWQISAATLHEKLKNKRLGRLIDVRTDGEWKDSHIREAEHIPLSRLLDEPPDSPADREIIVTCAVGYRGNIAASFLQSLGFKHVHSLAGGMKAWTNAKFQTVIG